MDIQKREKKLFKFNKSKFIAILVVVFLLGGIATAGTLHAFKLVLTDGSRVLSANEFRDYNELLDRYSRLEELRLFLKENFYRDIEDETILLGLFRGLFQAPEDPYTMYYTKEELDQALASTNGERTGLGVTLSVNSQNEIEVITVVENAPAMKAGIEPGDILISVNNIVFKGNELDAAVQEATGEPGTTVEITISRNGMKHDFEIKRESFIAPSVVTEILEGNIGYLKVTTFNQATAEAFEDAINEFENGGQVGVIIDVRNNGGGLVDQAIAMLDVMIDESVVTYTEDRLGDREPLETTDGKTTVPYVVLINKNSASAAEIFALGIKNMQEGKVIGETSFGKGVIQKILRFDDGDGARVTVMQYLAPDGTPIHNVGVSPDIKIIPTEDDTTDVILEKGIELLK